MQSINDITDAISKLDKELDYVAERLRPQVFELQEFVHLFATVNMVVEEMYYFFRLQ